MSFSLDIANFAKKAGANVDKVVRKTILDIGTRLVERTPVGDAEYWQKPAPPGYVGGHARANWSHSVGTRVVQEIDGIDPSGEVSNSRILASVPEKAGGQVHFLQNSVPYIIPLEDGHSRQAPNGMVAVTVTEFQSFIDGALGSLK
jgi:hypothetical protein